MLVCRRYKAYILRMSNTIEFGPYPQTLEKFVIEETGIVMQRLHVAAMLLIELDSEESSESIALSDEIRVYLSSQLEAGVNPLDDSSIPQTLDSAAQQWLRVEIRKKLLEEYHQQYESERANFLYKCLEDKILMFKSLNDSGFSLADRVNVLSGPDDPRSVIGRVVNIDLSNARIWVEVNADLPEFQYCVDLWKIDWETGELTQMAEISILSGQSATTE